MGEKLDRRMGFRKIKVPEIMLVLIFAAVSVLGVFCGNYMVQQARTRATATVFYADYAQAFTINGLEIATTIQASVLVDFADEQGGITFFAGNLSNEGEAAIYSSNPDFHVNPKSGRSLTYQDFAGRADVGMNFGIDHSRMKFFESVEDGKRFVTFFDRRKNQEFKVELVGEFGGIFANDMYRLVRNMAALEGQIGVNRFVLDAGSRSRTEEMTKLFEKRLEQDGLKMVTYEQPPVGVDLSRFFRMDILNLIVIGFCAVALVVCTMPVTLLWAQKQFVTIAVKRLLGFSTVHIFVMTLLRFMVLFHIGFLGAYGVMWVLRLTGATTVINSLVSAEVLAAYGLALVESLFCALLPIIKCMKIEPGDALRRAE